MGWRHRYGLRKWNLFEKLALISYSWIGKRRSSLTETLLLQSRKVFQLLLEPWRVSRGWEMVPSWWSVVRGPRPKTCSRPTIFIDRSVRVSVHKTLNSSRGVTRCWDLVDMLEVEIQDELKDQGVAGVNWVILKKEGKMIPTNTLFLRFSSLEFPKEITVSYIKVKVALFVLNLMCCFNCNKFGHMSQHCKVTVKCLGCGKDKHEGQCEGPKLCSNCNGPHASSAKDCPVWEKEIQWVCIEKCISFLEARQLVGTDAWVPCDPVKSSETVETQCPSKTASKGSADPSKMTSKGSLQNCT